MVHVTGLTTRQPSPHDRMAADGESDFHNPFVVAVRANLTRSVNSVDILRVRIRTYSGVRLTLLAELTLEPLALVRVLGRFLFHIRLLLELLPACQRAEGFRAPSSGPF